MTSAMTSTDTAAPTCSTCGMDIEWMAPEPGDGHGYWRHLRYALGNPGIYCYSATGANRLDPTRPRATPAPGQEHTGPGEAGPTPGEGFDPDLFSTGPAVGGRTIPAAADVDGDPVLFSQARAVELLAQFTAATAEGGDIDGLYTARWVGGAASIMAALLADAGVTGVNL